MPKEPDEAVERLVERGPEMFMDPAEEESARKVALEESVTEAVGNGLSISKRSACAISCIAVQMRSVVRCGAIPRHVWSQ